MFSNYSVQPSTENFKNIDHQFHSTVEKGHGRIETRRYWTMGNTEYLIGAEKWRGLKSIGMVESERIINGNVSTEHRYYLLSFERDIHKFAKSVRNHWSIENQLHWVLDVGFNEDASRCCRGYSAENRIGSISRGNRKKEGKQGRRNTVKYRT